MINFLDYKDRLYQHGLNSVIMPVNLPKYLFFIYIFIPKTLQIELTKYQRSISVEYNGTFIIDFTQCIDF